MRMSHSFVLVRVLARWRHLRKTRSLIAGTDFGCVLWILVTCFYYSFALQAPEMASGCHWHELVSEKAARAIRTFFRTYNTGQVFFNNYNVYDAHAHSRKLRCQQALEKDPIARDLYPGVVYEIPCIKTDTQSTSINRAGLGKRKAVAVRRDKCKHGIECAGQASREDRPYDHLGRSSYLRQEKKILLARLLLESFYLQITRHANNKARENLQNT